MTQITANGAEFNVVDEGTGPPVLLVHGFPLNHTMWQAQFDALSGDYRVIAPDLRGFGNSGPATGTLTMEQCADDLNALLDVLQVEEPISFCGLSMGGYVAWRFFDKYPQRLKSLILCDTRAAADTPEAAQGRLKTAETVLRTGPEPIADAMRGKLFSPVTLEREPDVVETVGQMMLTTPPESIAAALRGMAERPDSTALLAEIRIPTLVIVGADDQLTPADEMRQVAAAIGNAEFVEVAEAGHMSPMEQPEIVNAALERFLASHLIR